jgi:hypothetical protein
VARLIIAIIVGAVIATGAAVGASSALTSVSNGAPTHGSLFQYGNR